MTENLREKIVETNRDVKSICRTRRRMEERDAVFIDGEVVVLGDAPRR
jgi:hypothetical protein